MTDFVTLTELWNRGHYNKLGAIIKREKWSPGRVAEFCAYFGKYLGVNQLNILYKFL